MARLLVVDDMKFVAQTIAALLEESGHEVFLAADGAEAIEKAIEIQPDLILLDIVMPRMDGLEAARRLKSSPPTAHIPILMVSSKNDMNTIATAFGADVSDYVVKPFHNAELLEKVGALLGRFRMDFSLSEEDRVPLVTLLHDEMEGNTLDEIADAIRMTSAGDRPMVLDLSRVRTVGSGVAEAVEEFRRRMKALGQKVEVVSPEAGVTVSGIFPGLRGRGRVHSTRDAAIAAAREAFLQQDASGAEIAGAAASAGEAEPRPVSRISSVAELGITFEELDNLVVVRLPSARLGDAAIECIASRYPRTAHAVLLDLRCVEGMTSGEARSLASLAEDMNLSGRAMKIVNPTRPVAEALRSAGLGGSLFWINEKSPASPPR